MATTVRTIRRKDAPKAAGETKSRKAADKPAAGTSSESRAVAWRDRVPGPRTQREIKEEVLYETAARWFNRHGYHGTSLSDLAKELGISKAALYNYVEDKRELLYNIHKRSLRASMVARDRAAKEKTGLEKVRKLIYSYVSIIIASPTETFILLEDNALSPEQAEEILNVRRALDLELRQWITEGIVDESITPCNPKLVALMIIGGMAWISRWYDPNGKWAGEQVAEAMSIYYARMLSPTAHGPLPADVELLRPEMDE